MKILLTFLILIFANSVFAQTQTRCFQNGGLKDNHVFRFETDGGSVTGSYSIERDYDPAEEETYYFSGTRKSNNLTFNFSSYKKLQKPPFEVKKAILTLVKSGDKEILRAKFYGAGKAAVYSMNLEECEPNYSELVKNARRVSFAKGANSVMMTAKFQNRDEQKAFLLGARKGQTVEVEAAGCSISLYYPDKTQYEEGTAIDTFGMNLPQSGDYLFIIKPAGELSECSVNFKITN